MIEKIKDRFGHHLLNYLNNLLLWTSHHEPFMLQEVIDDTTKGDNELKKIFDDQWNKMDSIETMFEAKKMEIKELWK